LSNPDNMATDDHFSAPSGAEMAAAETAANTIIGGLKNYGIFPPDHASTVMLLNGVQQTVSRFIEKYGDLSFEVERQRLVYREKPMCEGEASVDNPVFILYRDGIRWFEFLAGIQEPELATFSRIFNHYRVIPEEPEDDLVTALWRANLLHIRYEASYEFWDNEPVMDLEAFQPVDQVQPDEEDSAERNGWESVRPESSTEEYQKMSLSLAEGGADLWNMTLDEQQALAQLVSADLTSDKSEVALQLMFVVLRCEEEPEVYESIVNYLHEEFRLALDGRNFRQAYFILDNMRQTAKLLASARPWIAALHSRFLADIIRPEVLDAMVPIWPSLSSMAAAELKVFIALLQLLPTKAGMTLAGMLARIDAPQARSLIVEIIASYATRDPKVLELLLRRDEEDLVLRLIRVMRDLPDRNTVARLLHQVKDHPRSKIRQEARRIQGSHNMY